MIEGDGFAVSGRGLPILVLDLGTPPPTGNKQINMSWQARSRLKKTWGRKVQQAAQRALNFGSVPEPVEGQRRLVVVKWQAPRLLDEDNALQALKSTVIDHLRRVQRKKVGRHFVEVSGVVPILWDDDPIHLAIEYRPEMARQRQLTIEVWVEEGLPTGEIPCI